MVQREAVRGQVALRRRRAPRCRRTWPGGLHLAGDAAQLAADVVLAKVLPDKVKDGGRVVVSEDLRKTDAVQQW